MYYNDHVSMSDNLDHISISNTLEESNTGLFYENNTLILGIQRNLERLCERSLKYIKHAIIKDNNFSSIQYAGKLY